MNMIFLLSASKRAVGKTKEEQVKEKKQELERRLQDVSGQLGTPAPPPKAKTLKKGKYILYYSSTQWFCFTIPFLPFP